jgi:hypothetical protein
VGSTGKARDAFNAAMEKGGEIAAEAKKVLGTVVGYLGDLAKAGVDAAKSATHGEVSVFGYEVDLNPFW